MDIAISQSFRRTRSLSLFFVVCATVIIIFVAGVRAHAQGLLGPAADSGTTQGASGQCAVAGCLRNPTTGACYCNSSSCQGNLQCDPNLVGQSGGGIPSGSSGSVLPPYGGSSSGGINASYIRGYASSITNIINLILVPLLISIAFIVFIYGAFNYFILGASDESKRKEGRQFVLYGLIGFVIIFCVWGLVYLFIGILNLGGATTPKPPTINW